MYKFLVRPLLFLIDPERVHHLVTSLLKIIFRIPGMAKIVSGFFSYKHPVLRKTVFGLNFDNPVGLAAGFDKNAESYHEFSKLGFGFIEIGTVTPKGQPGNEKPRLFRLPTDKALINRMGFNNNGALEAVEKLKKKNTSLIIGGNLGKNTATLNEDAVKDYLYSFNQLYHVVDYFVVNVSCPNISDLHKLQDKDSLLEILQALVKERGNYTTYKPILLKISPDLNFHQIDDVIQISKETSIDGIVATNTTITRDNLQTPAPKVQKFGNGGLSGLPLKERSTEIIRYIHQKTSGTLPIIGVGGIMSAKDAMEKFKAGASLVQIYTGFIYEGPSLIKKINKAYVNNYI